MSKTKFALIAAAIPLALALVFTSCATPQEPVVVEQERGTDKHLFIAFGQSNMRGPAPIRDSDRENIPEGFKTLNVLPGYYRIAAGNTTEGQELRATGQWYRAVPPLAIRGNLAHWQGQFDIGMSPADWFGRTMMARAPLNVGQVGVVVVAGGDLALGAFHPTLGTSVYFGEGAGGPYREEGRPSATERNEGYAMYVAEAGFESLYDAIISSARLAQEQGWVIKGIIMHQGESGRGLTYGTWGEILSDIYNAMLYDLGLEPNSIPILAGQLWNAGAGSAAASGTGGVLASTAALQAATGLNNAHVISSAGLTRGRPIVDNLHFGSEDMEAFGIRFAEKMLELVYGITP